MNNDKKNIQYYLDRRIRPKNTLIYIKSNPKILRKFKKQEAINCKTHGDHNNWRLRNTGKVHSVYPALRCKPCEILSALHWHYTRKIKSILKDARIHARTSNQAFNIGTSDIFNQLKKQKMRCNLSNIKFDKFKNIPSIDKISPKKGYIKNNIQFLTVQINIMKNKFDQKKFLKMIKKIYKFRILNKGKYSNPVFKFDYKKDLLMGLSTKEGIKLRKQRLLNKQELYCKIHGWHKLFRFSYIRKSTDVKCVKCDRITSRKYQKQLRENPKFFEKQRELKKLEINKFLKKGKARCKIHGLGTFFRYRSSKYKVNGITKVAESLACRKCDKNYGIKDRIDNPLKYCFINTKSARRKSKVRRFLLKYEDILMQYQNQNGRCYYTNEPFDKYSNRPSLERKNNNVEYTKENVVLASMESNRSKSNLSYNDFIKNIEFIYKKSCTHSRTQQKNF